MNREGGTGNPDATFGELRWDTAFFGIPCAKAVLNRPLGKERWESLNARFMEYRFVSIENRYSEPANAQWIGAHLPAFLADVNIQFVKKVDPDCEDPNQVTVFEAMDQDAGVLELADFRHSKFLEDPGLASRGGPFVYRHWLANSFCQPGKFFAVVPDGQGRSTGFALFSFPGGACVIELIAVASGATNGGIGMRLMQAVEYRAKRQGCMEIHVGTQVRNAIAVNFYHKAGFRQAGCHQIYHLWNHEEAGLEGEHEESFDRIHGKQAVLSF